MAALLDASTVGAFLAERGLVEDAAAVRARPLSGGVSNVVLAVEDGALRAVVKQALPRLRVADEWIATQERALTEAAALQLAADLTPGAVPAVLDVDELSYAIVIAAAPAGWANWKDRLLRGEADPAVAERLGAILAAWHRSTYEGSSAWRFAGTDAFEQLRVDPYHRTVMKRRPELAGPVGEVVEQMLATTSCLVHGDFSPKNVLVGSEDLWVLDFEVAHLGDPAFDLGFMLNHLLLKSIHRPADAARYYGCAHAFLLAYADGVPDELLPPLDYVLAHVGCLAVARVDGKSPAEYLTADEQETARRIGVELLMGPPASLESVWYATVEEL
jgi:5-methylthioribose kinase